MGVLERDFFFFKKRTLDFLSLLIYRLSFIGGEVFLPADKFKSFILSSFSARNIFFYATQMLSLELIYNVVYIP